MFQGRNFVIWMAKNLPIRLFMFIVVFAILLVALTVTADQNKSASVERSWSEYCISCPARFAYMSNSGLKIDADGQPHMAYGDDRLRYAWREGGDWHYELVDSVVSTGRFASLALESNGRAHISYYDRYNQDLKYAWRYGPGWQVETVDSLGSVGGFSTLALDMAGQPHIAYYDDTNENLKYARWENGEWFIETVDNNGRVGLYPSLALDAMGFPHISYYDDSFAVGDLKYASWNGSEWHIEIVESTGDVGGYTSLAIDEQGNPHISYTNFSQGDLQYTFWDGSQWQFETVDSLGGVGNYTSMVLDALGYPIIGYLDYTNKDPKVARWNGVNWSIDTVDTDDDAGLWTSVAIGPNGNTYVMYYADYNNTQNNGELRLANNMGVGWNVEVIETTGRTGAYSSVTLDSVDIPHVVYVDAVTNEFRYAWWHGLEWQSESIATGSSILYVQLSFDSNDIPHIVYFKQADLIYMTQNGGTWVTEIIDQIDQVGYWPSLALDSEDKPHVSYRNYTNSDLMYASKTGDSWHIEIVDADGFAGYYSSLALDANNIPHISYYNNTSPTLNYATLVAGSWQIETISNSVNAQGSSIAIDNNGNIHVAFISQENHLMLAVRSGTNWQIEMVDDGSGYWKYPNLLFDSSGLAHISYFGNSVPKYASGSGTQWQIETLPGFNTGGYPSLALTSNDVPFISFYNYEYPAILLASPLRLPETSVLVAPSYQLTRGAIGYPVQQTIIITNTGTFEDNFDVVVESTWPVTATQVVGPLAPNEFIELLLTINIPPQATPSEQDTAIIILNSQLDSTKSAVARLSVQAEVPSPNVTLNTQEYQREGKPGETITYTLQLTNCGNIPDSYSLSASSAWEVTLPSTTDTLAIGEETVFNVEVTIPISATVGEQDIINVVATSEVDVEQGDTVNLIAVANVTHYIYLPLIISD